MKYVIWSNRKGAFWRHEQMGYTTDPAEAGRYTAEAAADISARSVMLGHVGTAPGSWTPQNVLIPEGEAEVFAKLNVPVACAACGFSYRPEDPSQTECPACEGGSVWSKYPERMARLKATHAENVRRAGLVDSVPTMLPFEPPPPMGGAVPPADRAAPRCSHSACSQNYIETGDTACIMGSPRDPKENG